MGGYSMKEAPLWLLLMWFARTVVIGTQQHPAYPIQRVMLAAPMSERRLLCATAHVVDHLVGESDRVEVINDPGGVGEVLIESGSIAGCGVGRVKFSV